MTSLIDAARAITDRLPANIDHPDQRGGMMAIPIPELIALRDAVAYPHGVPKSYCHHCGALLPAGSAVRTLCEACKEKA